MSSLPLPFLSQTKAVVMMMDEGVCVYRSSGNRVSFIGGALWKNGEFVERVSEMIRRSGATSTVILNDAVEQHYRKEKITIPTAFDKANIIKRRLNVAFPNYPMRSAMVLKEATALAKAHSAHKNDNDKGDIYLFAAAPSTESFSRVVRSIEDTDSGIAGYGLLPLESAAMVRTISGKLAERWGGVAGTGWSILVGQHRGGGLRQIVVRGNELALTRVTPVDEPKEGMADVWAADVSQEIQATLSYLSRFGYVPEDGLNIIVVGNKQNAELLEGLISVPCNFEALTPTECGSLLGLKISGDDVSHFCDIVHAGWIGKKPSLLLPLASKEMELVSGPRKTASAIMLVLCVTLAGSLYLCSTEAVQLYKDSKNLEVAKIRQVEIERLYQEEIKRKEAMGIDVNLIKGSLEIHDRIKKSEIDVLALLKGVGGSLKDLRMDGFAYSGGTQDILAVLPEGQEQPVRDSKLILDFSFAGGTNPREGNNKMDALAQRLTEALAPFGFAAKVSDELQVLTYKGELEAEVGLTATKRAATDRYTSQITIAKVKNVQSSGN